MFSEDLQNWALLTFFFLWLIRDFWLIDTRNDYKEHTNYTTKIIQQKKYAVLSPMH